MHLKCKGAENLGIPPAVRATDTLPGPSDRGQNFYPCFPYPEHPSIHCSNSSSYLSLMIYTTLGKHQGSLPVQSFAILNEHCSLCFRG